MTLFQHSFYLWLHFCDFISRLNKHTQHVDSATSIIYILKGSIRNNHALSSLTPDIYITDRTRHPNHTIISAINTNILATWIDTIFKKFLLHLLAYRAHFTMLFNIHTVNKTSR